MASCRQNCFCGFLYKAAPMEIIVLLFFILLYAFHELKLIWERILVYMLGWPKSPYMTPYRKKI